MRPEAKGEEPAFATDAAQSSVTALRGRNGWWAFRVGLGQALQHWPLWLFFYAVLALLAGLLLAPLVQRLLAWIGYRLAAWDLANGMPGWLLAELLGELIHHLPDLGRGLLVILLTLPAWPFLLALPFVLLSGGALSVYVRNTTPAARKQFWPGIARFALPFTLLLLLEVLLLELSLFLLLALAAVITAVTWSVLGLIVILPILVALLMLILWWFEYARAVAVVEQQRNVLRTLGRGASFLWRNLGPATSLELFSFLLSILPYLPYYGLTRVLPSNWWPAHIVLQQLLTLAVVGTRLVRLAGQVRLVQARGAVQTR